MSCLELAHRNGHWVILNNIHLMPNWLIELEKKLDEFAIEGSHEKFRLYLSSDPSTAIPIGVLSRCIKLTNEPPAGLKANLKRAFANFSREYIEEVRQETSEGLLDRSSYILHPPKYSLAILVPLPIAMIKSLTRPDHVVLNLAWYDTPYIHS